MASLLPISTITCHEWYCDSERAKNPAVAIQQHPADREILLIGEGFFFQPARS
jgi:hypothetical protein